MAAGGHSLAATSLGEVYTWGRNDSKGGGGGGSPGIADSGQLGGLHRASVSAESPGKVCSCPGSGLDPDSGAGLADACVT